MYNFTRNMNIPYVVLIKQLFFLYSREYFSVMYHFELPRSCIYFCFTKNFNFLHNFKSLYF